MIYQKIADKLQDILGGDYLISYSNNHDTNWNDILPSVENEIKHGVLRVDSGTTTQVSSTTVRVEQLRLIVAIPEDRKIFDSAVNNLKALLGSINGLEINDDDSELASKALLYSGSYNDAQASIVNGNRWWIAEVVFLANFYNGIYDSSNVSLTICETTENKTYDVLGLLSVNYSMNKVVDGYVFNNSGFEQSNYINSITKQLTITVAYMDKSYLTTLLNNEETDTTFTLTYNNGKKTRTLTNMILVNVNESIIIGDIVKGTFTFILGE